MVFFCWTLHYVVYNAPCHLQVKFMWALQSGLHFVMVSAPVASIHDFKGRLYGHVWCVVKSGFVCLKCKICTTTVTSYLTISSIKKISAQTCGKLSQGCVIFFHKYCFPNWIHWSITKWSDSANTQTSSSFSDKRAASGLPVQLYTSPVINQSMA